jgi:hypothetical protein
VVLLSSALHGVAVGRGQDRLARLLGRHGTVEATAAVPSPSRESPLALTIPRRTHMTKEQPVALEPGTTDILTVVVDESMTADRFGNSGVHVLATPMLVRYFALAPHRLAMRALGPGQEPWAPASTSATWHPPQSVCASPSGRGRHGQRPAPTWVGRSLGGS